MTELLCGRLRGEYVQRLSSVVCSAGDGGGPRSGMGQPQRAGHSVPADVLDAKGNGFWSRGVELGGRRGGQGPCALLTNAK